jgi:hypothetical protein
VRCNLCGLTKAHAPGNASNPAKVVKRLPDPYRLIARVQIHQGVTDHGGCSRISWQILKIAVFIYQENPVVIVEPNHIVVDTGGLKKFRINKKWY